MVEVIALFILGLGLMIGGTGIHYRCFQKQPKDKAGIIALGICFTPAWVIILFLAGLLGNPRFPNGQAFSKITPGNYEVVTLMPVLEEQLTIVVVVRDDDNLLFFQLPRTLFGIKTGETIEPVGLKDKVALKVERQGDYTFAYLTPIETEKISKE